jgi:DNA/RNA endonuclease G (NUC1)
MGCLFRYVLKLISLGLPICCLAQQDTLVDKKEFKVLYSQQFQQPLVVWYSSTNRPQFVKRASLDFHPEPGITTSKNDDYKYNRYDKGHLAPAASFSDSRKDLETTFSYLNCVLQYDKLNRGQWKQLEEMERRWDDRETLYIRVDVKVNSSCIQLPTGAVVPQSFRKHIYFAGQHQYRCFEFPNGALPGKWDTYEVKCKEHQ